MSDVILSTSVTRSKLPDNWKVSPIESICLRVTSGGTPSRKEPSFYDGGTILWTKSSELKDWYVHDTSEKITQEGLDSSSAKLLPKDTVLLALYGDGRTITSLGLLAQPAACNQACCAMICKSDECHPQFLLYSLKYHRNELIGLASGASQRNLSGKLLKQFPIAVPPPPTQHKVASILSAYDDLIENNTRRIAILEEMALAVYREWFVNFKFPGHEDTKFVKSPIGSVPDGWLKQLGDVVTLKRGYDLPKRKRREGRIPIVSSSGTTDYHDEPMVKGPGVVTGRYGTLGQVFYLEGEFWPLNTSLYVKDFHGNEPLLTVQLLRELDLAGQNAAGAVPGLNRNALHMMEVAFPPPSFQEMIAPFMIEIEERAANLRRKNDNLRATRDLLLPKLISGQLDVGELDIDSGLADEELLEATA